jgi:acyl carrier protein
MDDNLAIAINSREEVLEHLKGLLIENLDINRTPDQIDPDTPLFGSGLGLDSVDAVELIVAVQVGFGVQVSGDTAGRMAMRTVNSMVDYILSSRDDS